MLCGQRLPSSLRACALTSSIASPLPRWSSCARSARPLSGRPANRMRAAVPSEKVGADPPYPDQRVLLGGPCDASKAPLLPEIVVGVTQFTHGIGEVGEPVASEGGEDSGAHDLRHQ